MSYEETISDVVRVVEAVGVAIMVIGGLIAAALVVPALLRPDERATPTSGCGATSVG